MSNCCHAADSGAEGACIHQLRPGVCAKGIAPVCLEYLQERPLLKSAPQFITCSGDLHAVAAKLASAPSVAIAVRMVNVEGYGPVARACGFAFEDGSVLLVDLYETGGLNELGPAISSGTLLGLDLKRTLLSLAHDIEAEPRDLLDLSIVSQVLEAGDDAARDATSLRARHLGSRRTMAQSLNWSGCLTRVHAIDIANELADAFSLADVMLEEAFDRDLLPVVELENQVLLATVEMQARGLPVDEKRWFDAVSSLNAKVVAVRRDVTRSAFAGSNSDNALQSELRSMESVLNGFARLVSGALNAALQPRVSGELEQCGTTTGRFACRGIPLLSLPHEYGLRDCFVAPEHRLFVRADFSCFELRVLAALAKDEALLALFSRGEDAHQLIASELLHKPAEHVVPEERARIKPVSFGTIFGMRPEGVVALAAKNFGIELSVLDAAAYQQAFFARFPGIAAWQKKILSGCAEFVPTRLGRTRRANPSDTTDGARLAFPVQGSAADVMKLCVADLYWSLKAIGAAILLVLHDEVIVECAVSVAEEVRALLEARMPELASSMFPEVQFVVNARMSKTLGAGKD